MQKQELPSPEIVKLRRIQGMMRVYFRQNKGDGQLSNRGMSAQGELLDDTEARAEEEAARADNAADEAARAAEDASRAAVDAAKADARIRRLEQQVSNMTAHVNIIIDYAWPSNSLGLRPQ